MSRDDSMAALELLSTGLNEHVQLGDRTISMHNKNKFLKVISSGDQATCMAADSRHSMVLVLMQDGKLILNSVLLVVCGRHARTNMASSTMQI